MPTLLKWQADTSLMMNLTTPLIPKWKFFTTMILMIFFFPTIFFAFHIHQYRLFSFFMMLTAESASNGFCQAPDSRTDEGLGN